jgi:23S rRNA (uracil1939-C5)-methyltransferase
MTEHSDKTYTVSLTKMVYGGDAMGRLPDGRAVFVPYALPGETVRVRLIEEKRGYTRADLLEVIESVPERIPPRCPRFAACGGCHYQHIRYDYQLKAKQEILLDQLQRIGGFDEPPVADIVPSSEIWNYRNHIQLHVDPDGKLGFQEPRSNQVIPITDCPLAEEYLNVIWPQIELEGGSGIERVSLRLGVDDDVLVTLEGSQEYAPEFMVEDLPISAVYMGPSGPILLAGSGHVMMEVINRPFKVSAGSFFQVNTRQAERMVAHLIDNLPGGESESLLELYSGVGLFSAFLAPNFGRLVAVEEAPSAIVDFTDNLDEFEHVELYETTAEIALSNLDLDPDVILVDPPRAGLGRTVVDLILKLKAPMLAYVSCDPATLARDAKQLASGGYVLKEIVPFDMFPQTYHIESISTWERSD